VEFEANLLARVTFWFDCLPASSLDQIRGPLTRTVKRTMQIGFKMTISDTMKRFNELQ